VEYTIKDMGPFTFIEDKKNVSIEGYAFLDKYRHCIIIVFGENRRDVISEYLK
jgi:hypothetical protein